MSWRADSQMLATSSEDGRLIQWFAEDGFPARSTNAQAGGGRAPQGGGLPGVMAVHYAHNGQIATCGRDDTARIWNAGGNQVARIEGFDLPSRVAFSHDDERLFIGGFTGKVRVWSLKEQKFVGEVTTNPQ